MRDAFRKKRADTISVVVVFCVFAASVLIVLILGARIYQNISDISRTEHGELTALAYVWTAVKNNDDAGALTVGRFHDSSALFYDEIIGDRLFRTVIYLYDGWVKELFFDPALELGPEDGAPIVQAETLFFEKLEYGLIKVSAGERSLLISPRAG